MNLTSLLVLLVSCVGLVKGANILALFNLATKSHHIWHSPLFQGLASRGHNVTVLSTVAHKTPVPNITDLLVEGIYEYIASRFEFPLEEFSEVSPYSMVGYFANWLIDICGYTLTTQGMKTLLEYPQDFKFDLILFEPMGAECLLGVRKRFGSPPLIAMNGLSHAQWIDDLVANPDNPSYMYNVFLSYNDRMNFLQRTNNAIINVYMRSVWHWSVYPAFDGMARKHFGPSASVPSTELRRVSVVFANTHPSFDYPRPLLPSIVDVAGMHIKEPKHLPKDIQVFLDEAKQGAIFFSLGSNVRSDRLQADKIRALLAAFAELPERVLWKWESDSLPEQPRNVKVGKWLPQSDILAHPNVRLFITHSGLLSTQEAVHRGVPMIGVPFFMDQQMNIHKVIDHGVGVKLEYKEITKDTVLKAVRTVLDDPRYRENMRQLSARFRDQPELPLERALYWCEYVMRHKGAHHLRSAAMDLAWYQYLLLDVIAALTAAMLVPIFGLMYLYKMLSKKQKQIKQKKH